MISCYFLNKQLFLKGVNHRIKICLISIDLKGKETSHKESKNRRDLSFQILEIQSENYSHK